MNRTNRLLSVALALLVTLALGTPSAAGPPRSTGRKNVSQSRNSNVNRNTNVNVNRDVDIDVDVDHHHHGSYYGGCCYHNPIATAVAVTATAIVVGSIVNSIPSGCTTVIVNGFAYQQCGSTWCQPQIAGSSTTYIVVNAPR